MKIKNKTRYHSMEYRMNNLRVRGLCHWMMGYGRFNVVEVYAKEQG